MQENAGLKRIFNVKIMAKVGLLGAISFILMYLEVPLWFTPEFYKMDFSEVSVLIGAFALGPIPGVAIEFIKIVLHLILKGTTQQELAILLIFSLDAPISSPRHLSTVGIKP